MNTEQAHRPAGLDKATVDIEPVTARTSARAALSAIFTRDPSVTYRAVAHVRYARQRSPELVLGATFEAIKAMTKDLDAHEAWTPEMSAAVFDLECQLVADGWTPTDAETEGLPRHYHRPAATD